MKNIIAAVLSVFIILNCIPAYANENTNIFVGDNSVGEIKDAENNIVDFVNSVAVSHGMDYVEINDIDYSKSVKFYYAEILKQDELTDEIMKSCIDGCEGYYYVPFYNNGKTAMATVQQNVPLIDEVKKNMSDEEIEEYNSNLWKWHASVVSIYDEIFDYRDEVDKALEENNIENANVYFVSGISQTITAVAVICTDNPDDTKIKILEQFDHKTEGDGGSPLDKNVLHTLDEIKEVVSNETPIGDDEDAGAVSHGARLLDTNLNVSGENNEKGNTLLIVSIVSGVAVIAIAAAVICVIRKKNKMQSQNSDGNNLL